MNSSRNILLVVTVGLLAICLCVGVGGFIALQGTGLLLSQAVESNPESVTAVSDAIAEYTLPAGYEDGYAVNIGGFSLVMYTALESRSHIYLIQAPPSLTVDQAELEHQMRQMAGTDDWTEVTVVEHRPCQIRGQETTLVISEGENHNGRRYRSASALFDGKEGLALVNVSGPAFSWDQEMMDTFIESIH